MKNNGLRRLVALLAVIFVGNLFSMKMTERGKQNAQSAAQKIIAEMKKQPSYIIKQKIAALKPGECFVCAQGTSDGVVVPWVALENSNVIKNMVEDLGGSKEKLFIPLPFSFNTIQKVMKVLVYFNDLYDKKAEEEMWNNCSRTEYQEKFKGQRYYSVEMKNTLYAVVRKECQNISIDEIVQQINCIDYLEILFYTAGNNDQKQMVCRGNILPHNICNCLYSAVLTEPYEPMIKNFVSEKMQQIYKINDCYTNSLNDWNNRGWFSAAKPASVCNQYEYPKNYDSVRNLNSDIARRIIKSISEEHRLPYEWEFYAKFQNLAEMIDSYVLSTQAYGKRILNVMGS